MSWYGKNEPFGETEALKNRINLLSNLVDKNNGKTDMIKTIKTTTSGACAIDFLNDKSKLVVRVAGNRVLNYMYLGPSDTRLICLGTNSSGDPSITSVTLTDKKVGTSANVLVEYIEV